MDLQAMSYEDALSRLEGLVAELERGEGTLEAALNNFQEGMRLSRLCAARLAVAEEAIQKVVEEAGRLTLEPFTNEEG